MGEFDMYIMFVGLLNTTQQTIDLAEKLASNFDLVPFSLSPNETNYRVMLGETEISVQHGDSTWLARLQLTFGDFIIIDLATYDWEEGEAVRFSVMYAKAGLKFIMRTGDPAIQREVTRVVSGKVNAVIASSQYGVVDYIEVIGFLQELQTTGQTAGAYDYRFRTLD